MTILRVLQIIACAATVLTGLLALVRPRSVRGFTGLNPEGPRGISEVRAVLGGLFIALGAAPLALGAGAAYAMLGIGYLGIALVRAVSIVADRSYARSNWISLAVEIVLGVLLVWPSA
jgi:hypothetical protein